MAEDVAVVGWAQTVHSHEMARRTDLGLAYSVVNAALDSCGLSIGDIEVVIDAGSDFLDGRGISNCVAADALGAHLKEESKVAGDGLLAAIYAYMRLRTGMFSTALVVAYGKSSQSGPSAQSRSMAEPFYTRPLGLDALAAAALQARSYTRHYGVDGSAPARVAVKNRAAGVENPHAQLRTAVSLGEVLGSREVAPPIRELEAGPVSDGACALVMTEGSVARALRARPAWLVGVGMCTDPYFLGSRDLQRCTPAAKAARSAYRQAGVFDPGRDLDLVELSEPYAYQELMLCEALGLCDEGEGADLLASGTTTRDGGLPVNVSGGVTCANPLVATGLVRLAEAAAQVTGRAGPLQVRDAKRALAHSSGGLAMQTAACAVVER
ncbi:MAG: thiolase family protein [Actinobacteria bacterium]|nr:thiolase family protein [Actinomycetota bacterium]MBU1942112.1 thiolase family protein [Actinomycetota bacterium]MBU2686704.1 thiolase family protein [Actinomycetota bacterium]